MTTATEPMDSHPLIAFVTARLGERKAIAQDALQPHHPGHCLSVTPRDPDRVLAELEATRKIIANARTTLDGSWQLGEEAREATAFLAVRTLQHLAGLDAEHPDYDPAWEL